MPRRLPAKPSFVAETIAIGSELLVGGRSDSNSLRIGEALGRIGIEVRFKSIVGDNDADIVTVLNTQLTLFQAEDALSQAQLARLLAIVSLYQALGGGWEPRMERAGNAL